MSNQNLKKLKRVELLQLLVDQMKENDALRSENRQLLKKLEDRKLAVRNCGSLAEAALQVNGVFAAAEEAAKQYLDNIQALSGQADRTVAEARQAAQTILHNAQSESAQLVAQANLEAEKILSDAQREAHHIKAAAMETWEAFIGNNG